MATTGSRIVQVLEFASARAPELQALHEIAHHEQMVSPADVKLGAQKNQRRRRANAFKSHRMPQRLRQKKAKSGRAEELIALPTRGAPRAKQVAAAVGVDEPEAAKQRCRKHERRPHKLVAARSWQAAARGNETSGGAGGDGTDDKGKAVWMATHLWHSKRMKMSEKYGMVVPAHRADKSVSASLEAVRSKATLHDMSYYGVLELYGLPQLILEALELVSDPAGSDFHGMRFLSGGEEGQSVLYHEGRFPAGAISPVTFMWRPLQADSRSGAGGANKFELHADWQETKRQLWLWIHPAAFVEAANAIASACQSVAEDEEGNENDPIQVTDRRGHLCRFKLRGALADDILEHVCEEPPLSSSAAIAAVESGCDAESDHEDGFQASKTVEQCASANLTLLLKRLSSKKKQQQAKKKSVKQPSSGSSSSPGSLYSVVVSDPRVRHYHQSAISSNPRKHTGLLSDEPSLLREPAPSDLAQAGKEIQCPVSSEPLTLQHDAEEPASELILTKVSEILRWTRTPSAAAAAQSSAAGETGKASAKYPFASPLDNQRVPGKDANEQDAGMPGAEDSDMPIPCSYLWSHSKRQQLNNRFQKDHFVNQKCFQARQDRAKQLAPGSTATTSGSGSIEDQGNQLHLIAIEKTGAFPNTSGWDLILPPSFAPALLQTSVFSGALVVGMDEDEAFDTVLQKPSFPRDFPDTQAGESYWKAEAGTHMTEYLKRPKAKRFSYGKHGIASPFQPDWKQLFVPKNERVSMEVTDNDGDAEDPNGEEEEETEETSLCVLRGEEYMQPFCFYKRTEERISKIPVAVPTLVRVVLSVPVRASLAPNALLFSPTADDIKCFYSQKHWNGCEITDLKAPEQQRSLVGFVTSAVYDRPKGAFRATGFSACEPLQDVFLQQRELLKSREALVMVRTPHAKMYRPVLIRAEA